MDKIITLTIAGLILIGAEIFVPGGILGFFGICAIGAAVAVAWLDYGTYYGLIALVSALALVLISLLVELYILRRTSLGRRFFLTSQIKSTAQSPLPNEEEIIGKSGEAVTRLTPSGVVRINGRRYEALSQSGMLDRGAPVVVVGRDAFRIVVRIADAQAGSEDQGGKLS